MNSMMHKQLKLALFHKVGTGYTNPLHASLQVIAKSNRDNTPFSMANEVVSAHLATILGLPVPPNGVAISNNREFFYSANFNSSNIPQEQLTPDKEHPSRADWSSVTERKPELCWGIILFDMWIMNADRGRKNLAYNYDYDQVIIFDHGACLYAYSTDKDQPRRLSRHNTHRLEGFFNHESIEAEKMEHILMDCICSTTGLEEWYQRIRSLPEWQIKDACFRGLGLGYKKEHCEEVADFLIDRRGHLLTMILNEHETYFPSLKNTEIINIEKLAQKFAEPDYR